MEKIISLQLPAGSELAPLQQNNPTAATNIGSVEHTSFTPHPETDNQIHDQSAAWGVCGFLALAAVGLAVVESKVQSRHRSTAQ